MLYPTDQRGERNDTKIEEAIERYIGDRREEIRKLQSAR